MGLKTESTAKLFWQKHTQKANYKAGICVWTDAKRKTDLRLRTVSKALFVDSRIILSLWGKISRSSLKPSSETHTPAAVFSQWSTPKEHGNRMRVKPRMRAVPLPACTQPLDHFSPRHPGSQNLWAWPPRSLNFFLTAWYISSLSDYKLLSPLTQTTATILFKHINCGNTKYKVYTSTYIPIIKDKYMLPYCHIRFMIATSLL